MPYGRRKAYRRGGRRRAPYRRRSATIPPAKKTTRTYVRKNALVNRRQSRQIRSLWNRQFGPLQRNLQNNNVDIFVNATQPVCFDASDFTSLRAVALPGGGVASNTGCTIWQPNTLLSGIASAALFTTDTTNALWAPSNLDNVGDSGRFKPIRADYQFEISGSPKIDDTWVQIDLFTQHHGFQRWQMGGAGSSNAQRVMPHALVNMTDMIQFNEFNPSLFKRYKRIRIYLNSKQQAHSNVDSGDGVRATTGNTKFVKFSIRPKKERRQVFTNPEIPGTTQAGNQQEAHGNFGEHQVDPRTPLWCMISTTDRTGLDGDSLKIAIRRHVVFRDSNGGTLL